MRESNYWLILIKACSENIENESEELEYLINESQKLKLISGSNVRKSKK